MSAMKRRNFITACGSIVRVNAMKTPHSKIHVTLAGLAIAVAMFLIVHPQVDAQTPGNMREMMQSMMGSALPPGIDPKLLPDPDSHGAHLLTRYCSQCHNLPGPGMHTAAEWPAVVQRMNGRMQMMSGGMKCGGMMGGGMMQVHAPSATELSALLAYLQKHAQKPIDISQYPDMTTTAGKTFHTVCSQCHVLPDPLQHTATEWPNVVTRMKKNMSAMHKKIPDETATQAIVSFLQQHARAGE